MLSELLLCALTSTNIGMKNSEPVFGMTDLSSSVQIQDSVDFEKEVLLNYENEYSNTFDIEFLDDGAYVKNNFWYKELQVEQEYNDYYIQADVISPFFGSKYDYTKHISGDYINKKLPLFDEWTLDSSDPYSFWPAEKSFPKPIEYDDYDGFCNKVTGRVNPLTKFKKQDKDFFRFYLYGQADVTIKFDDSESVKLYLTDYNPETMTANEKMYPYNKEIFANLNAGTYYICVYSTDEENSYSYSFDIRADYYRSDYDIIDISEDWYDLKTEGVAWISDLDPFNSLPFYNVHKNSPEKESLYLTTALEGGCLNHRYLQSSLYIWGDKLKGAYKAFLNDSAWNAGIEFLEKHRDEEVRIRLEKTEKEKEEYVMNLFLSYGVPGASIVLDGWEGIQLFGGVNLSGIDAVYDPLIHKEEERQIEAGKFLDYINTLKKCIDISIANEYTVLQIDSYYEPYYYGNLLKGSIDISYSYDVNTINVFKTTDKNYLYCGEHSFRANSKGSFYRLKNAADFKDAQHHIVHHYRTPSEFTDPIYNLSDMSGGDLPMGKAEWYYFTPEESGTYCFSSGQDKYPSPSWNLVGEIFDKPITSRDPYEGRDPKDPYEGGFIISDDSGGNKGHFKIHYYLEAGETVFLRVHEKTWHKEVQNYCIRVEQKSSGRMVKPVPNENFSVSFKNSQTTWSYLRFATSGNKIIQSYTYNAEDSIELYDYRGQSIAKNNNSSNKSSNAGIITAYVNSEELYLLRVTSPQSNREGQRVTIFITPVNELCTSNDNIPELKVGDRDTDNSISYNINSYETAFAFFTPEYSAYFTFYYENVAYYDIDLYVFDFNNHSIIRAGDYGRFLEGKHTYIVMASFTNFTNGHGTIKMGVNYYETYLICAPKQVENIAANQRYVEKIISVVGDKANSSFKANDYYFTFDRFGRKIFNLAGISGTVHGNAVLKLYDDRNTLLATDDGTNGSGDNAFIVREVERDRVYRVRVEAPIYWASSNTQPLKLSIINGSPYVNTFGDIKEVMSSISGYSYNMSPTFTADGVFRFVAPHDGYVDFELRERNTPIENGYIYVIDANSSTPIDYDTDYVMDVIDGNNSAPIRKKLIKGHSYFVIVPQKLDNYYLDIKQYGADFINCKAKSSIKNTLTVPENIRTRTFHGTYTPNRTGYVVFDTLSNFNFRGDINLEITDFEGHILSTTENIKFGGKSRKVTNLEKGKIYKITISVLMESRFSTSSEFDLLIEYSNDRHSDTFISISEGDRYFEKVYDIGFNEIKDLYLSFDTDGLKIIQTFGQADTRMSMYSSEGELLFDDDDSGYRNNAYIVINVTAHEIYRLRLHEKTLLHSIRTKLTITPISWMTMDQCCCWSFDEMTVSDTLDFTTIYANIPYSCYSFVFEPTISGKYRFKTETYGEGYGTPDTYLCVIDVNNSSYITEANENDDDKETNSLMAKLEMNLIAGHKYFVVSSMCDLYNSYEGAILLNISYLSDNN